MTIATSINVADQGTPASATVRAFVLFAVFTLLVFPIHEFGHYLTYRALGVELRMTLNTASPADQSKRVPIAELAGPLVNVLLATVAAVAYLRGNRRRQWLAELALASTMMRLVVYVLVVGTALVTGSGLSLGNDEPIAAKLWGVPSLTFVALFAVPFVCIVGYIVRTYSQSWQRRTLHVLARGCVTLCLGIVVGNVVDPWLFGSR